MKNKLNIITLFILIFSICLYSQSNPCEEFNNINTKVRDGKITKEDALAEIQKLIPLIKDYYYQNGGVEFSKEDMVFPLEGYTPSAIGGKDGSGYKPQGYDYFDGNKHSGHPAHDIFIYDKNQDELDDYTHKPVNILSISNGVVVAAEPHWDVNSDLRGGKYIYIYDPAINGLFYYAHNKDIFVKPGDIIRSGDIIAHCGRTGLNAYKKRSPTHLHLMFLSLKDGYPKPQDIYQDLLHAKTK